MKILRDPADLAHLPDAFLRALIAERLESMADGEPFDPDVHGFMVVAEVGDVGEDVAAAVEAPILDEVWLAAFGFEGIEAHERWYEAVIVPDSGDFGIVLFVPREPGIDQRLLDLCARQAVLAPDE